MAEPGKLDEELDALLRRECEELSTQHGRRKPRDGLAHQQRFFLPMAAHELRAGQATEQGKRLLDIHG